ncbi:MAG: hypothetical protein GXP28_05995 [Planctomycetes bacterium]|nr:hypothetical protein [Planctomycetota bacterium]
MLSEPLSLEKLSTEEQTFLRPVKTAPDSVTLEIFQVRIPANDVELTEELWSSIDEQRLGVALRRNLVKDGFRAGVLGGAMPDMLARYLNLQSEMPEVSSEQLITDQSADPRAIRRVIQLNRREAATVQASDLQPQLFVMTEDEKGLKAHNYDQVQAVYSLRAEPVAGQRVSIRLTPELQHGEMRNRYSGSARGIFLMTPSREREIFDQLEIATDLAAGELLVVSCLSAVPSSLGQAFHAIDRGGPAEHKMLLVRLLQVPGSEILADAGPE